MSISAEMETLWLKQIREIREKHKEKEDEVERNLSANH